MEIVNVQNERTNQHQLIDKSACVCVYVSKSVRQCLKSNIKLTLACVFRQFKATAKEKKKTRLSFKKTS